MRSTSSRSRVRVLAVIALALALPSTAALAADPVADEEVRWRGPLRVRSQFPLDLPTLDLTPDDASLLRRGETSIDVLLVHSNTFELTPGYDARVAAFEAGVGASGWDFNMDGESTRLSVRADFGVTPRIQLGVEVALLGYSGGFLDSTIDSVHESTGLPENDRGAKARDEVNLDFLSGLSRHALAESETSLGDTVLRGKLGLVTGDSGALAALVEIKAPTGDDEAYAGSGSWDYGVSLLGSAGGRRHFFHGGLGVFFLGQPDLYPVEIDDRLAAFAGYEMKVGERWSLAAQVTGAESILPDDDANKGDRPRAELTVGAHYGREGWQLTFGIVENLTTNDNAADLGLVLGSRWILP